MAIIKPRDLGGSLPRDSAYFSVDRFGAPTVAVNPVGSTTTIDRDSLGQPVHVVGPTGDEAWQTWTTGLLMAVIQKSDTSVPLDPGTQCSPNE